MADSLIDTMRGAIESGNDPMPMVEFYSEKQGHLLTVLWDFGNVTPRGATARALATLGRCFGANRVRFAADSFYREFTQDETMEVMPSQDPLASEILVVLETTAHEVLRVNHYPYYRQDDGSIRWDDEEELTGETASGEVLEGLQAGLRGSFPLLFPRDATWVVDALLAMVPPPLMVMPMHESVADVLGAGQ